MTKKLKAGNADAAASPSDPPNGMPNTSAGNTPTDAQNVEAQPPTLSNEEIKAAELKQIEMLREVLGIKNIEKYLKDLEGQVGFVRGELATVRSEPASSAAPGLAGLMADPMIKNLVNAAISAITNWAGINAEPPEQAKRRLLFEKVQQRIEQRVTRDLDDLADRIANGTGLSIVEDDKVGKPDGGKIA